jgi:hypothetical protein
MQLSWKGSEGSYGLADLGARGKFFHLGRIQSQVPQISLLEELLVEERYRSKLLENKIRCYW